MHDVRIDEAGELRCWSCGSKSFTEKRTGRAKILVGVGALVTKKKLKCQVCGEYNDVGSAKPYKGPANKRFQDGHSEPIKHSNLSSQEIESKLIDSMQRKVFSSYKGYNGSIEIFDDHVGVTREGKIAKMGKHELGTRIIPFAEITDVYGVSPDMMKNGYIQLGLNGQQVGELTMFTAGSNPETVLFTFQHRKEFEELLSILELIAAKGTTGATQAMELETETVSSITVTTSKLDQLIKLGQLRDNGVISIEEFEKLKLEIV